MSDKTTRRELLRPLHLLLIALGAGLFAGVVTLFSTGAFTSRVNSMISSGDYDGLTPLALSLVVGGGAFIVTVLLLAMMILVVDPADFTKPVERPVLYPSEEAEAAAKADEAEGTAKS